MSSAFCDSEKSEFLKRINSFPTWMISSSYNGLEAFGKHVVAQESLWFSLVCSRTVNYRKPFLKKINGNEGQKCFLPCHGYLELVNGRIKKGIFPGLGLTPELGYVT